ncbi:uncharacterized protein EDB93DRAFT_1106640 [Suillus bovinus]|uniref:uncharacterized protein n=1 Tax=Suillus bovinus TaxID=48563 RepID=UPI001B8725A9|nr:uncharacterized protein EDB93DRAFT_1106640 [Suillus bovinus]KAG2137447.1 hypothetical protein EDB93DRAFT_1106640 [Suillus bovinus]
MALRPWVDTDNTKMHYTLSLPSLLVHTSHPIINGSPCDAISNYLLSDDDPPILDPPAKDNPWAPFQSCGHFQLADFIFQRNQMPGKQIDKLMQILASFEECNGKPPFCSDTHIYDTIDFIFSGDISWQSLSLKNDFYPLYVSARNLHNNVCCVHKESVSLVGFLSIPKMLACLHNSEVVCMDLDRLGSGQRSHQHTKALMRGYSASKLKDGWGIISGILSLGVKNIHDLLAPDILHQILKGTFKDHIVDWIGQYLVIIYEEAGAEQIWADIDCCIAAVPACPGLHRFPQGRKFKQWTSDDSKALMKVFLPAIVGHVPDKILSTLVTPFQIPLRLYYAYKGFYLGGAFWMVWPMSAGLFPST